MIDWMIDMFSNIGQWLMQLLPLSPFSDYIDSFVPPDFLGWLNWFFPVHDILVILGVWLVAVGIFYGYSVLMRWVKIIGD